MALSTLFRSFWDDSYDTTCDFPASRFIDQQPIGGVLPAAGLRGGLMYPGYLPYGSVMLPRWCQRTQQPPQQAGVSEVVNDEKEFCVSMDVQHFKPEEVCVRTKENRVIVSASHGERPDEHGYIARSFTRQYVLPKDVDPVKVTSSLSVDGVLTLKAPKLVGEAPKERVIPIIRQPEPTATGTEVK